MKRQESEIRRKSCMALVRKQEMAHWIAAKVVQLSSCSFLCAALTPFKTRLFKIKRDREGRQRSEFFRSPANAKSVTDFTAEKEQQNPRTPQGKDVSAGGDRDRSELSKS